MACLSGARDLRATRARCLCHCRHRPSSVSDAVGGRIDGTGNVAAIRAVVTATCDRWNAEAKVANLSLALRASLISMFPASIRVSCPVIKALDGCRRDGNPR